MLDIKTIREREQDVRKALTNRGSDANLDAIIDLDQERRTHLTAVESLKHDKNTVSREIGRLKKAGEDASEPLAKMKTVGERISELDRRIREVDEALKTMLLAVPNIPHTDVPVGPDETGNRLVRTWGEPARFDFEPRTHIELGEHLNLLDLDRAARMSGSGFPLLVGLGARLQRLLIQFMLDVHTREHAYEEVAPPYLCTVEAMTGTGQLPKLAQDMYQVELEGLYLIPTGEVPVTNMYRDEIIRRPLPIRHVTCTPCFRREAGAAGRDTRGLIRVHQFEKVELVKFVEPEHSYAELETLVADAETILQRLGLPYRVRELCTGDLSFAAARCYDIEVWAPGQKDWLEISSCSNFEDFQARRMGMRYRPSEGKPRYPHTLNGSGVALPRLVVALLEHYQNADGSVRVPEALQDAMKMECLV